MKPPTTLELVDDEARMATTRLNALDKRFDAINDELTTQSKQMEEIVEIMGLLAEKVKALVKRVEFLESRPW